MGLLWKKVNNCPDGGVFISGISNSCSELNPFWRFVMPWQVFRVEYKSCSPVWVYFQAGDLKIMRCRKKIITPYFAARIGIHDVRFCAIHSRMNSYLSLTIVEYPKLFNYLEIRRKTIKLNDGFVISSNLITRI